MRFSYLDPEGNPTGMFSLSQQTGKWYSGNPETPAEGYMYDDQGRAVRFIKGGIDQPVFESLEAKKLRLEKEKIEEQKQKALTQEEKFDKTYLDALKAKEIIKTKSGFLSSESDVTKNLFGPTQAGVAKQGKYKSYIPQGSMLPASWMQSKIDPEQVASKISGLSVKERFSPYTIETSRNFPGATLEEYDPSKGQMYKGGLYPLKSYLTVQRSPFAGGQQNFGLGKYTTV